MKRKPSLMIEDCGTCGVRGKSVLCDLAGQDLAAFQKIKRTIQYEPHQTIFYEGHACLGLYLLCAGKVKLTRSSARGQRQIVRILDGGELIEKHAFRDGALHEVTCETLERSQICLIEKEPYLALIQRNPQLAIKLIQLLSSELGMHMDQLDQFTFKTARERLAGLLLELGDRFGKKAGNEVLVGITLKREEVAEMAGVTVETVIRLLGAFRDEGLVGIDGRVITLLRPDRLARIARL
ncbi:MAG: Crp/Fnr family transcriptional regulator [Nitrospirae bacterium]|nr:Crp/Fnr family transcriptional regulator [Nitrospirota bacterium]